MKRILLVNPHETEQSGFTNPPLGLLYLAGTLLKHGFEVRVADGCLDGKEAIEKALKDFIPELVGITCLTPGRTKALETARMAKDAIPGVKVAMGGAHPTIMYRQMLEHFPAVDYIVIGEGEQTLLELAQEKPEAEIQGLAYRQGRTIVKTSPRAYVDNLDDIPFPAWHLVDLRRYPAIDTGTYNGINLATEPRVSVIFSRGCPGRCDFCSTWWIWRKWRRRSPVNMVEELELLNRKHGIRHFCFADDAMTVDREATLALCDQIIARGLNVVFHVTTRTDCVDEELLHKLKEAGCYKIAFGIESGSPALLQRMDKNNDVATAEKAIKLARRAGIMVTALLIVGNVGETDQTVRETISLLRRAKPDEVGCVGGLWILPGTKLYQKCQRKGYIDDDFWLGNEPLKVYTAEHSLEELARLQKKIRKYQPLGQRLFDRIRGIMR